MPEQKNALAERKVTNMSYTFKNIPNKVRRHIYQRDGFVCALCGSQKYIQIHHYILRSQGGGNHPMNLITLCADCHAMVHDLDTRNLPDITKESTEQAIVEYLADYYMETWNPKTKLNEFPDWT